MSGRCSIIVLHQLFKLLYNRSEISAGIRSPASSNTATSSHSPYSYGRMEGLSSPAYARTLGAMAVVSCVGSHLLARPKKSSSSCSLTDPLRLVKNAYSSWTSSSFAGLTICRRGSVQSLKRYILPAALSKSSVIGSISVASFASAPHHQLYDRGSLSCSFSRVVYGACDSPSLSASGHTVQDRFAPSTGYGSEGLQCCVYQSAISLNSMGNMC